MKLFKKKITQYEMGLVLNEMVRLRSQEVLKKLNELELGNISTSRVQITTYIFNLFIASKILSTSYQIGEVNIIVSFTKNQFNDKLIKAGFSDEEVSGINDLMENVFETLNDICNFTESTDYFNSYVRELAKLYLELINNTYGSDEVLIAELTIIIMSWLKYSEFLKEEYKVTG